MIRQSDRACLATRITPRAVEIFKRMQALPDCLCASVLQRCTTCDAWNELHGQLHDELKLMPWQWYAIEDPDAECPPPDGGGAEWFPQAQKLYCELETAAVQGMKAV